MARLCIGLALGLALMWASSYRWLTTIGFDFEEPRGELILTRYYRIGWDVGCFWVGGADLPQHRHGPTLDWWDPGGMLFVRSVPPAPRSLWNRLGWWWIPDISHDPFEPLYRGAIASRWIGIPGWIPAALAGWYPLWRWRRSSMIVQPAAAG